MHLKHLTTYCWSRHLSAELPDSLTGLRIISAVPNIQLENIPSGLTSFAVHDAAILDDMIGKVLSRGTKSLLNVVSLDLSCTSVSGEFIKFLPPQLKRLELCATPLKTLPFSSITSIEYLDVSHTLVSDATLKHIPVTVKVLNVSFTRVTPPFLVQSFLPERAGAFLVSRALVSLLL